MEGDIELINKDENFHHNHAEKYQRMRKEVALCLASVLDAYHRGR